MLNSKIERTPTRLSLPKSGRADKRIQVIFGWCFGAFLLCGLIGVESAAACEMCKSAVVTNGGSGGIDGTGSSAGLNFNTSIYYMLGGVFSVMGWIGWIMYRSVQGQGQGNGVAPMTGGFPPEPK